MMAQITYHEQINPLPSIIQGLRYNVTYCGNIPGASAAKDISQLNFQLVHE